MGCTPPVFHFSFLRTRLLRSPIRVRGKESVGRATPKLGLYYVTRKGTRDNVYANIDDYDTGMSTVDAVRHWWRGEWFK
jgi:hypothetical protein